jgi:hypothetical protein
VPPQGHEPQGQWFQENGRYYGVFHKGQYMLPVDEVRRESPPCIVCLPALTPCLQEELDRLDIFHKFFHLARQDDSYAGLHQRALNMSNPQILDLGCGTGIWAIDMAECVDLPPPLLLSLSLQVTQPLSIHQSGRLGS